MIDIIRESNGIAVEQIKPDVLLIRGYAQGLKFPDPFDWVFIAVFNGSNVICKGMLHRSGCMRTAKQTREVLNYFRSSGFNSISFTRIKNGRNIFVNRKL